MINVPSHENFGDVPGPSIWPNFEALYHKVMDDSFATLGRSIILHLTPIRVADSGLLAGPQPAQYNPLMGQAGRGLPNIVTTVRNRAMQITTRDVSYTAHIKHGPKEIDDKDAIGRLEMDQVATTTAYEAIPHLLECESATIDGLRYKIHTMPRAIGLQTKRYVITIWQKIPEMQQGSQVSPNGT